MGKEIEEKNKYQEALDNAISDIEYCYNDSFEEIPEKRLKEVELLQQLVDKETPIKVKKRLKAISPIHDTVMGTCLNCGEEELKVNCNYCPNCGQKLKW